ncbi:MAG TPA: hypothetical protein EYG18_10580 [Micavibrio sp.]|nr:hypothetical protein [Micavibrio sp.]HIL29705.1 hypothetical protein [Micavibrio sp.]
MLIMEADGFGDNLFLLKADEDTVQENMDYWQMFRESQPMTIMGSILSEVIALYYDVPIENFGIVMHDRGNYFGLQLGIGDEVSQELQQKFADFLDDVEEFCDGNGNAQFDEDTNLISAPSKDDLLIWLREFCDAADVEIHPDIFEDPEEVEEMFTEEYGEKNEWRDVAEQSLKMAWVMAVLPEKIYGSRDALLKDAYRIRRNMAYNFEQVEAAISKEQFTKMDKPYPSNVRQRHRGNLFEYH